MKNPFPKNDPDRHAIWDMLVERDIAAFVAADWQQVAGDFLAEAFFATDAGKRSNPDGWKIAFADMESYQAEWIRQAEEFRSGHGENDPVSALHELTTLRDIEVRGDRALAHKKFDGGLLMRDGTRTHLCWQTLYHCRKVDERWKICGFTGYLPNPMGGGDPAGATAEKEVKRLPQGAAQHLTAGPYSPVLEVEPGKLVVISGQAALDPEGRVVGDSIEDQAKFTLDNCFKQLATAGCSPADVFKVNIYMTDLAEWQRMNAVYQEMMPEPRPVRTAVQSRLLLTLKVEIEMWAVKP